MVRRELPFRRNRSVMKNIPAPTGGWNARDNLGEMPPKDAVKLVNLFPSPTSVNMRLGYTKFATGTGQVESLLNYTGAITNKLIAIAGGSIYDVTAGGAFPAASVAGLTNSRWQYINVSTPGGNFIETVNGVDGPYVFDGTTWSNINASITGATASTFTNINMHKNRVWFIDKVSLHAFYLPLQSYIGAVSILDLTAFCPRGGVLQAMATWTIDGGVGMDDLAVFVTSRGDVIVYKGTDPASQSTWSLVGVFQIGSPIGDRCFLKYGGDLLLITVDGVVPLAQALLQGRINERHAITDKILYQMNQAIINYQSNFGWQLMTHPKQQFLLLNIPVRTNDQQQQFVMDTINGSWCNFTGWLANCWEIYKDALYFGGNGYVGLAWNTTTDNGAAIPIEGLQAFNYFDDPGRIKRFTLMRPLFFIDSSQQVNANMNADFDTLAPSASIGTTSFSGTTWDSGVWDTNIWADALSVSKQWQGTSAIGYCGAPHIQANINGATLQWVSTDVVMEPGAIL